MRTFNDSKTTIPQHSLAQSILYHLLPGFGILLFYVFTSSWVIKMGFKPSFGVLLGFVFVGIPMQLFIMFKEGGFSWKNVIFYRKRIPIWQYVAFSIIFILYALIVTSILGPFNLMLQDGLFSWLPDWFIDSSPPFGRDTSLTIITISFIAIFLIDGLLNPIVEEFYFRGFLLPRISRYRIWSPFINAVLFSLAHYWQPWNMVQIFILVAPVYYLVWRKQNIYISIVVHCLANLIGGGLTLGQYLSA